MKTMITAAALAALCLAGCLGGDGKGAPFPWLGNDDDAAAWGPDGCPPHAHLDGDQCACDDGWAVGDDNLSCVLVDCPSKMHPEGNACVCDPIYEPGSDGTICVPLGASFQPGDGPLWVTVRGAYFDDERNLRLDLGGMRDFVVDGMERLPLDVDRFMDRLAPKAGSGAAGGGGPADPAPPALKLDRAGISVRNATFEAGRLAIPGGHIDIGDGTRFDVSGTARAATISGRVGLAGVDVATDGIALKAGAGRADLEIDYRVEGEDLVADSKLDNMSLDTRYAVHKRANGDYVHLAEGKLEDATLRLTTRLARDLSGLPAGIESATASLDIPRFEGRVHSGRVTVPDGDGTATIELGSSAVKGSVRVDGDQILLKGHISGLDAAVWDFDGSDGGSAIDIDYARLKGSGDVRFSSTEGFSIDGDIREMDVRAADLKGSTHFMDADVGRTLVSGRGKVKFDSNGGLSVAGDLRVDTTLDSAKVHGSSLGRPGDLSLAPGSRIVADVQELSFTKDGRFRVAGDGRLDLGVDDFQGGLGGGSVAGKARLTGDGQFRLDSERGVDLPDNLNVAVDVSDGRLGSPAGAVSFDIAEGSRMFLNLDELQLSREGTPLRVEIGPGSTLAGKLDSAVITVPGLGSPLTLASGSKVEFAIYRMAVDGTRGLPKAEGRLSLDAVVDLEALDLDRLRSVRGVKVTGVDGGSARLRFDVDRAVLREDGSFDLQDVSFSLSARFAELTSAYRPNE